ncbi:hypothetical protein SUZIE_183410 [Sciurus carolinensis]|uniref:Uncharacterized protein n=1 Tax=Sciurus carolinensis TaxID=30640 RepID=A0AA41N849_SCICA|nr:hypothetical protein [Sciurus carolinensis]
MSRQAAGGRSVWAGPRRAGHSPARLPLELPLSRYFRAAGSSRTRDVSTYPELHWCRGLGLDYYAHLERANKSGPQACSTRTVRSG